MKKAQSYIIQFIIFFVVGFVVFLSIGSFFKIQSDFFINELSYRNAKIVADYITSTAISLIDSCKECEDSRVIINLNPNYEFIVKADNVWEIILPNERRYSFSLSNLNYSVSSAGSAVITKTLTLTFSKTENKLRVE
ncbi:MAG: hypothetical protein QXX07_00120 [Candidatus Aenigmatarchaeota archaeon]